VLEADHLLVGVRNAARDLGFGDEDHVADADPQHFLGNSAGGRGGHEHDRGRESDQELPHA
jgi:hypothetical protein